MTRHARTNGSALALTALALLLLVALAPTALAGEGDGLVVERFEALLDVQPDGSVEVREAIAVDFGTVEHHGIVRAIPVRYAIAEDDTQVQLPEDREPADYRRVIEIDRVTVDSTAPDEVELSREDDLLLVRIGDPDRTVTGQHTYELRYTVTGALGSFDDRAELTWDVTGESWDDPIAQVRAVVEGPEVLDGACAEGSAGSTRACASSEVDGQRAEFTGGPLAPGEGLTVSVGFPQEAVEVPPPLLEERWRLSSALLGDERALPLTAATTLVALVALVLLGRMLRSRRREVAGPDMHGVYMAEPPDGLRPAQVRMVAEEQADVTAFGATLLDLAARDHLRITPSEDDDEAADGDEARPVVLRRVDRDNGDLLDYERRLLDELFADGDELTSEQLAEQHGDDRDRFTERVAADALARGWFPERPGALRTRRVLPALGVLLAVSALFVVALLATRLALAVVPLLVAAVAGVVVAGVLPTRTREGARLAAQVRAFRTTLEDGDGAVAAGYEPTEAFGRLLPYAVALGVVAAWVDRFRTPDTPMDAWAPVWLVGILAASGSADPSAALTGFSAQVATGQAPSTSTSGGGVSVGGGFGGGGGGGW